MSIHLFQNYPLDDLNTLRIRAFAKYYVSVKSETDLQEIHNLLPDLNENIFILGGGSNLLFTKDYEGLVVHIETKGITIIEENDESVLLEVLAGEPWPELVEFTVSQNWGGLENLALIPGNAGSAPVQNIAAYGQNFSNICEKVEVIDLISGEKKIISNEECEFGYRTSIFKKRPINGQVITKVYLKLNKAAELNLSYFSKGGRYDSISQELKNKNITNPSIKDVFKIVCSIRSHKLLDWKIHPTVGSFFINPLISKDRAEKLLKIDPNIQLYPAEQLTYTDVDINQAAYVKVPVGRLLDILGWKGKQIGNCKVHEKWASIFTHNGNASGREFLEFTQKIANDVKEKLEINLESEVSIV